ncbi:hypothetical protein O6H91_12G005900 [Diphasiastrum complanatum]|uniref:Uncharacterized protein n=1 Tax=Diphasiastrum complanatum TaxID=34168 RepID=A0ACC2BYK4_DIPCM|nr:hypothetical protein O6H91_12G005900 [Diphasiastrum complanatum]
MSRTDLKCSTKNEAASCSNNEDTAQDEDVEMDRKVWVNLPPELLDRILAHLPIQSLFRCRSVCNKWNSLPFTPAFIRIYAQISRPKDSWLLMFADVHYKTVFVLLPDQSKWFDFPLSFLPSNIYYVTGAGGLFCFRLVESNGASSMCVCNPLTKKWKKLPPLLGDFYAGLVGMVADSLSYQIIVRTKPTGSNEYFNFTDLRTEIYDSRTSCWRTNGIPEDDLTMGKAICNGVLYFMTWEARNGVYSYNVDQGLWMNISAPWPYFFTCPHLVECRGRLFMVGGFGKQHVNTVGIRIWELQQDSLHWELIDSMPFPLFDDFLTRPGWMYFDCVGHEQHIYFINYERPPLILRFDTEDCLWHLLVTNPPAVLHKMFLCFSFTPTLNSLI